MGEAPLYVKLLMFFFVVVYMVSVTMETTRGEIITALNDRRRMGLALLANLVIVPILGFILVRLFDLRPELRIGLMMLAVSPGGLFALQFARVSKGNRVFAVALLIILSILAILITPVLAYWFFYREGPIGGPLTWLVVLFSFLVAGPLLVGRALQMRFPEVAPKLGRRLGLFSIALFIMAALLSGRFKTPALKVIGADDIVATVVLTVTCWAVGWILGGPEIKNRKVLAISTAMRNFGVCVPLANHYFSGNEGVIASIFAYSAISIPMNMVFALVIGRTLRDAADGASR